MYYASKKFKKCMDSPLRNRAHIQVNIGIINSFAQSDGKITSELTDWSNERSVWKKNNVGTQYATFEENQWKADGSQYLLPERNVDVASYYTDVGLTSKDILGSITITFGQIYDLKGLTVRFGEFYPTEFTITVDGGTFTYTNDSETFETSDTYGLTRSMVITPITMIGGQQRLRIEEILMGVGFSFNDEAIKNVSSDEDISFISNKISAKTFTQTAIDLKNDFNVDDTNSYINYLQTGQKISCLTGLDLDDGTIEWIPQGVYYLKDWSKSGMNFKLTANSRLAFMTDTYSRGNYIHTRTLYDDFIDVMDFFGLEPDEYNVDDTLKDITVSNPFPSVSGAQALQLIANAGRCVCYEDRYGVIQMVANFSLVVEPDDIVASSDEDTIYSHTNNIVYGTNDVYADFTSEFFSADGSMYLIPQKQTNLFPTPYFRQGQSGNPYTTNGITWTVNDDGTISFSGTATTTSFYVLTNTRLSGIQLGHTYRIEFEVHNAVNLSIFARCDKTGETVHDLCAIRYKSDGVYTAEYTTPTTEYTLDCIGLYITTGTEVENGKVRVKLVDASIPSSGVVSDDIGDYLDTGFVSNQIADDKGGFYDNIVQKCTLTSGSPFISNGITWTNTNDIVVANGKVTDGLNYSNYWFGSANNPIHIEKGYYYLSGCPSGGDFTNTYRIGVCRVENGNTVEKFSDWGDGRMYEFTEDSDIQIFIQILPNVICNNLTFKPMLVKIDTDTVSKNLITRPYYRELVNGNPWTHQGVTYVHNSDGSVYCNGTASAESTTELVYPYLKAKRQKLIFNKYYLISDGFTNKTIHRNPYIQFVRHSESANTYNYDIHTIRGMRVFRADNDDLLEYGVRIVVANGQTANATVRPTLLELPDDWYKRGENECKLPYQGSTGILGGLTFVVNEDGSITANGTATSNVDFMFHRRNVANHSMKLKSGNYALLNLGTMSTTEQPTALYFNGLKKDGTVSSLMTLERNYICGSAYLDANDYNYSDNNGMGLGVTFYSGNTYNNVTIKPVLICLDDLDFLPRVFDSSNNVPQTYQYGSKPRISLELPASFTYYGFSINFDGNPPTEMIVTTYNDNVLVEEQTFDDLEKQNYIHTKLGKFDKLTLAFNRTMPQNRVLVSKFSFSDLTDYKLKFNDIIGNVMGIKEKNIKTVRVKRYTFLPPQSEGELPQEKNDEVYYNVSVLPTGDEAKVTNPLISSEEHARLVAEWIANYYMNNISYSCKFRGDPTLNATDIIYLDSDVVNTLQVEIEKHTFTYNGAFGGSLEMRRTTRTGESL